MPGLGSLQSLTDEKKLFQCKCRRRMLINNRQFFISLKFSFMACGFNINLMAIHNYNVSKFNLNGTACRFATQPTTS